MQQPPKDHPYKPIPLINPRNRPHIQPHDLYKPVWVMLLSDTGEATYVNVKSGFRVGNRIQIMTYTSVPGMPYRPERLTFMYFDCHGSYWPSPTAPPIDAPPDSVAGFIAESICTKGLTSP